MLHEVVPATCCVEGWATTGTTTPLDLVRLVGAPLALVRLVGFFMAGLETKPEFVMALFRVLPQNEIMSVVILLFVTLFVPVLLWHKDSQK